MTCEVYYMVNIKIFVELPCNCHVKRGIYGFALYKLYFMGTPCKYSYEEHDNFSVKIMRSHVKKIHKMIYVNIKSSEITCKNMSTCGILALPKRCGTNKQKLRVIPLISFRTRRVCWRASFPAGALISYWYLC